MIIAIATMLLLFVLMATLSLLFVSIVTLLPQGGTVATLPHAGPCCCISSAELSCRCDLGDFGLRLHLDCGVASANTHGHPLRVRAAGLKIVKRVPHECTSGLQWRCGIVLVQIWGGAQCHFTLLEVAAGQEMLDLGHVINLVTWFVNNAQFHGVRARDGTTTM